MKKIISRKEAKELGLKYYFTGIPCIRGHIGYRYTSVGICQTCSIEAARKWAINNPEKYEKNRKNFSEKHPERIKEWRKNRYHTNKEKAIEYSVMWKKKNPEKSALNSAKWRGKNKDKIRTYKANRRALELKAMPKWFGEFDVFVLREAYRLCKLREIHTSFKWEVDHKIPLKSKIVCGLHCATNIQLLIDIENMSKGNKRWIDMP